MVKTRELTESERGMVVGQYRAGRRQVDIAINMRCSQSTVSRILAKFKTQTTLKNCQNQPVTTPREDRAMMRFALRQRFVSGKRNF